MHTAAVIIYILHCEDQLVLRTNLQPHLEKGGNEHPKDSQYNLCLPLVNQVILLLQNYWDGAELLQVLLS